MSFFISFAKIVIQIPYFCTMRFLSADWIYPLHISPIKEGVLQVSDEGEIINIFENNLFQNLVSKNRNLVFEAEREQTR